MIAIRHAREQIGSGDRPVTEDGAGAPAAIGVTRHPWERLASANDAFADANAFHSNGLRRFRRLLAATPFAYTNLLIPQGRATPFAFSATRGSIRVKCKRPGEPRQGEPLAGTRVVPSGATFWRGMARPCNGSGHEPRRAVEAVACSLGGNETHRGGVCAV